jgi:hypothetical protein
MQLTCTVCHAQQPLEAMLKDEAGRELMGMLVSLQPPLLLPLVHYLGFFRPAKQQLGWGRSLRLAREVVDLAPFAADVLAQALTEANRGLDEKRLQGGFKPLGNHNYLRRVLETLQAREGASAGAVEVAASASPARRLPRSQAGQALVDLEGLRK